MCDSGGIAIQIGDTAIAVELRREVELPSAWCVRHRDQTLVAVDERLLTQGVVDGHFHIVVAESQGQVEVLENLAVGFDLGTVGVGFPVKVVDAHFVGISIAVEDDLVDEIGAVEIDLQYEFAPTHVEVFGQINAVVPSIFHLWRVQETDNSCRCQHGGVFGQNVG